MEMTSASLLLFIYAAAAVAGKTVVQEVTKSAYGKVKDKFADLFGRRGSDPLVAVEANPKDETALSKLRELVDGLSPTERDEIAPLVAALAAALGRDVGAQKLAQEVAAIRLDVVGENVVIQRVEGSTVIDIKAEAKRDFIFTDIKMQGTTQSGN